jgi:hypothetical protein
MRRTPKSRTKAERKVIKKAVADLRAVGLSPRRALAQARAEVRKGLHSKAGPL